MDNRNKIPVICLAPTSVDAFRIFNPNDWAESSRAIIQSCSTELSVLHYEFTNIQTLSNNSEKLCHPHLENLKRSCDDPSDTLNKIVCYAQVPEIHVFIKAFFSSLKGLLDLVVQLLSSEKIVHTQLDGFHRKKDTYGGSVINALSNNVCAEKKQIAQTIKDLIETHKKKWIDDAIKARNLLVHPTEGIHQLMFHMVLESYEGSLNLKTAVPPSVGDQTIDKYAKSQVENIEDFCKSFLRSLRNNVKT